MEREYLIPLILLIASIALKIGSLAALCALHTHKEYHHEEPHTHEEYNLDVITEKKRIHR